MAIQRRPQPHREARDRTTEIRWTPTERREIGQAARRLGLSISSLVRSLVLPAVRGDSRDDAIDPDPEEV